MSYNVTYVTVRIFAFGSIMRPSVEQSSIWSSRPFPYIWPPNVYAHVDTWSMTPMTIVMQLFHFDAFFLRYQPKSRPWKVYVELCTQYLRLVGENQMKHQLMKQFSYIQDFLFLKFHRTQNLLPIDIFSVPYWTSTLISCQKYFSFNAKNVFGTRSYASYAFFAFCFRFDCFITTLETSWHWGRSAFAVHMFLLFRFAFSIFRKGRVL